MGLLRITPHSWRQIVKAVRSSEKQRKFGYDKYIAAPNKSEKASV